MTCTPRQNNQVLKSS